MSGSNIGSNIFAINYFRTFANICKEWFVYIDETQALDRFKLLTTSQITMLSSVTCAHPQECFGITFIHSSTYLFPPLQPPPFITTSHLFDTQAKVRFYKRLGQVITTFIFIGELLAQSVQNEDRQFSSDSSSIIWQM